MTLRSGYVRGQFSQNLWDRGVFVPFSRHFRTLWTPFGHHLDTMQVFHNFLKIKDILSLRTVRTPYKQILMCVRACEQINNEISNLSRTIRLIYGVLVSENKKKKNFQRVIKK